LSSKKKKEPTISQPEISLDTQRSQNQISIRLLTELGCEGSKHVLCKQEKKKAQKKKIEEKQNRFFPCVQAERHKRADLTRGKIKWGASRKLQAKNMQAEGQRQQPARKKKNDRSNSVFLSFNLQRHSSLHEMLMTILCLIS
jgi:hypothetical protein